MVKNTKVCRDCSIDKPLNGYYKSKRHADKLFSECKTCVLTRRKKYFKENPDKLEKRIAYKNKYNKEHMDINKGYHQAYYVENKERARFLSREWDKNNRGKSLSIKAKYRASKLSATPSWSECEKIALVYDKAKWLESITGLKYHVDHIIPLQGANVCGLHCWENLQILDQSLNTSKSNKEDYYIRLEK